MAGFIQNIIWNSVEGFVEAGTRSAGEFAGNALIKAGDMIENGGRGVGNSIEKKATGYGTSITGQKYQPSPKALPSTARKPVVKRSNSLPASNKPTTGASKSVGPKPVGANKYPGANQVGSAKKAITGPAKSITSGAGASTALPPASSFKKPAYTPKPFNTRSNSLPKPYSSTNNSSFPSTEKKTAVKPGQSKPFTPPTEQKKQSEKKAYPGQGSRTPVQNQKPRLKPLPRLGPQIAEGQKMTHLAF